jgi:hypothetical protein
MVGPGDTGFYQTGGAKLQRFICPGMYAIPVG